MVDDQKTSRERVTLAHKEIKSDNPLYYETQLVRAVESILAPLDWDRNDIRRELNGTRVVGITDWTWRTPSPLFRVVNSWPRGGGEQQEELQSSR
jgi:hypothetical protein